MDEAAAAGLGIRAKLNLGVGIVVLISALAFGSVYALIERSTILAEKREHLVHVASLASLSFEGREGAALREDLVEFNRHLSEATGAPHHIRVEDQAGRIILGSGPESTVTAVRSEGTGLWHSLFPSSMAGEVPIRIGPNGAHEGRLVVQESLRNLPGDLRTSFLRHVTFAAALFGLAALCTSLLAHFLVVRPIRELASATERIGASGSWEPFTPSVRRRDEVGILCDRFAELSRRLLTLVRDERYGSAHLVAMGVVRGLEEPVRHAELELAALSAALRPGSDELRHCENVAGYLDEIVELGHRLKRIGGHPPQGEQ